MVLGLWWLRIQVIENYSGKNVALFHGVKRYTF